MAAFIIRRLILTLVVVLVVSFFAFSLIHIIPGDPAAAMLGADATKEMIEAVRKQLWLDRPFIVQYGHWLFEAIQGNFGMSIFYHQSVSQLVFSALPITGYLAVLALIVSTIIGIVAGIICAIRRGGVLDNVISVFSSIGVAVPIFWVGILGIYLFSLRLGWLPTSGFTSPFEDFGKSTARAILPVFCLAIPALAVLARQTRSSMLEVIQQDYIRTAKAKGLRERVVVSKHALKNALIPVVTLLGIQLRVLIGSSVLVETIFNIPGMGRLLVQSALSKDFLLLQGGVMIMALIVCLVNLAVDVSYGWLDPRVKYE